MEKGLNGTKLQVNNCLIWSMRTIRISSWQWKRSTWCLLWLGRYGTMRFETAQYRLLIWYLHWRVQAPCWQCGLFTNLQTPCYIALTLEVWHGNVLLRAQTKSWNCQQSRLCHSDPSVIYNPEMPAWVHGTTKMLTLPMLKLLLSKAYGRKDYMFVVNLSVSLVYMCIYLLKTI